MTTENHDPSHFVQRKDFDAFCEEVRAKLKAMAEVKPVYIGTSKEASPVTAVKDIPGDKNINGRCWSYPCVLPPGHDGLHAKLEWFENRIANLESENADLKKQLEDKVQHVKALNEANGSLGSSVKHLQKQLAAKPACSERCAAIEAAIEDIRAVACGEKQVANDDTDGMKWIFDRCQKLIAMPKASPETPDPKHPKKPCVVCGKLVCTADDSCDGASLLNDHLWACSPECWEEASTWFDEKPETPAKPACSERYAALDKAVSDLYECGAYNPTTSPEFRAMLKSLYNALSMPKDSPETPSPTPDWNAEFESALELIPEKFRVRVREGGGPEDVWKSLVTSIAKAMHHQKPETPAPTLTPSKAERIHNRITSLKLMTSIDYKDWAVGSIRTVIGEALAILAEAGPTLTFSPSKAKLIDLHLRAIRAGAEAAGETYSQNEIDKVLLNLAKPDPAADRLRKMAEDWFEFGGLGMTGYPAWLDKYGLGTSDAFSGVMKAILAYFNPQPKATTPTPPAPTVPENSPAEINGRG